MAFGIQRFRVMGGIFPFPIDMLRKDCAWPSSENDAQLIQRNLEGVRETVTVTLDRAGDKFSAPTLERWQSFGWTIVGPDGFPIDRHAKASQMREKI